MIPPVGDREDMAYVSLKISSLKDHSSDIQIFVAVMCSFVTLSVLVSPA